MKKFIGYILAAGIVIILDSCTKEETTPASTLPTTPEAVAADDAKSGGVYKGVLVGSTGVIKVTLQKGVTEVRVTLDGVTKILTTASLDSWTSGQPIKNALFTKDDWQGTFTVAASGATSTILLEIPGHATISALLTKETSTALVRAFEGTYAGSDSGTWNFTIQGPSMLGISKTSGSLAASPFFGLVAGNTISLDSMIGSGTISGDDVSGTWQGSTADIKGTWRAKRIL